MLGITGTAVAWPPGVMPTPPPAKSTRKSGRPPSRWRDPESGTAQPMSEIAAALMPKKWRTITWREGTRGPQSSRFAAVRIRTAHRHAQGAPPSDELWLLCEWPQRQARPSKLYISNLPAKTSLKRLVYLAKLRWRIERDYQEMKSELGLDHSRGEVGEASTITSPASQPPTPSSPSSECVFPLRTPPLSLPAFRRVLQHVLLRALGVCPLCCQTIASRAPPCPSRM